MARLKTSEIYLNEVEEGKTPISQEDFDNIRDTVKFFTLEDGEVNLKHFKPENFYIAFCNSFVGIKVNDYINIPKGIKKFLDYAGICENGRYVLNDKTEYFYNIDEKIKNYTDIANYIFWN